MADAALGIGKSVASSAIEAAKAKYVEESINQYNEDDVKKAVLSELQQIKDDTAALREKEFKTARDVLTSWQRSKEPIGSDRNRHRLRLVSENAATAVNVVPNPLDKMTAISFLIYADYHLVALDKSDGAGPDWAAGKGEAQSLLRQYVGSMEELSKAAKEELGLSSRIFLRNKDKRRELLWSFVNLSAAVFALPPSTGNGTHPRFEQPEEAVLRMCKKDRQLLYSPRVRHIIQEPLERSSLKGHSGSLVYCCAILDDGMRAVSGCSGDGTLVVWDLASGWAIRTLVGHTDWVRCCAVSGKTVVSGSLDRTLKVWDADSGAEIRTLRGHDDVVKCCAMFPDGSRVLSGAEDRTLTVWDVDSGAEISVLKGHTGGVSCCARCCAVFAGGERAISGDADGTLRVWDVDSGAEIRTLEGHGDSVECCAVSADRSTAISGSADRTLKVWEVESGEEICTLTGHTDRVYCCALYAGDTRAVSGGGDETLRVWDLANGVEVHTLRGHTDTIECCAVSADGTRLVSGDFSGTLKVWDLPFVAVTQAVAPLPLAASESNE